MKWFLAVLVLCCTAAPALSGYGSEDPRRENLYQQFTAPCCWRDNLTNHDSAAARTMRAEIDSLMAAGQSDEQIKQVMVTKYSSRALVVPEGNTGTWLFWMPPLILLLGLGVVVWFLRRMRHAPQAELPGGGAGPARA